MDEQLDPEVVWLVEEIVDDLTKYNIVSFVYGRNDFRDSLANLAARIGVRADRRFDRAVMELAASGVVRLAEVAPGIFSIAPSSRPDQRGVVSKLLALPADSSLFVETMRRLTRQSLKGIIGLEPS